MPLPEKDHLARPKRERREDGWMPDPEPRFGSALVDKWHEEGKALDAEWESAQGRARFRHSSAGACARAVSFAALGAPREPMDAAGHYVTRMGHLIHQAAQEALPESDHEVRVELLDGEMAGHADTLYVEVDGCRSCIEYKSVGGFRYKLAIGDRGPAQGPAYDHVIQASLNGRAKDADEVVLCYLTREAISIPLAKRKGIDEMGRVVAEWTLPREQYEPIADKEIERIEGILALVDGGELPRRIIPDPELPTHHRIVDPLKGSYAELDKNGDIVTVGETWHCAYCSYRELCATTGPDREEIPVELRPS